MLRWAGSSFRAARLLRLARSQLPPPPSPALHHRRAQSVGARRASGAMVFAASK